MSEDSSLRTLGAVNRESVADQVFNKLYQGVISLELLPGAKLSEVEVSKALGVSRQPVRDAFYRLSKLGFLEIRPQRATMVSKISERAVMQARFIRTALEIESIRVACEKLTDPDMDMLADILRQQEEAVEATDKMVFHELDDRFHREICERAGVGFIWKLIQENKAHMDRVRFLSLSFATLRAYDDHIRLFEALRRRDVDESIIQMRSHLSAILEHFTRIRSEHLIYFAQEDRFTTP
jgi:DNA-binding GntR family transcriptional regulator